MSELMFAHYLPESPLLAGSGDEFDREKNPRLLEFRVSRSGQEKCYPVLAYYVGDRVARPGKVYDLTIAVLRFGEVSLAKPIEATVSNYHLNRRVSGLFGLPGSLTQFPEYCQGHLVMVSLGNRYPQLARIDDKVEGRYQASPLTTPGMVLLPSLWEVRLAAEKEIQAVQMLQGMGALIPGIAQCGEGWIVSQSEAPATA